VKPVANNDRAFNDLCFLNPKHKLVSPITRDTDSRIHSNISVEIKDSPIIGKPIVAIGTIVQ
jgi:hypothetical protein